MIGIITASGPEKTVVTFRDGERLEFRPPENLYYAGQTVVVEFATDRSFIVSSLTEGELVRQGVQQ